MKASPKLHSLNELRTALRKQAEPFLSNVTDIEIEKVLQKGISPILFKSKLYFTDAEVYGI